MVTQNYNVKQLIVERQQVKTDFFWKGYHLMATLDRNEALKANVKNLSQKAKESKERLKALEAENKCLEEELQ